MANTVTAFPGWTLDSARACRSRGRSTRAIPSSSSGWRPTARRRAPLQSSSAPEEARPRVPGGLRGPRDAPPLRAAARSGCRRGGSLRGRPHGDRAVPRGGRPGAAAGHLGIAPQTPGAAVHGHGRAAEVPGEPGQGLRRVAAAATLGLRADLRRRDPGEPYTEELRQPRGRPGRRTDPDRADPGRHPPLVPRLRRARLRLGRRVAPRSMLEAMAFGRPVASLRCSGSRSSSRTVSRASCAVLEIWPRCVGCSSPWPRPAGTTCRHGRTGSGCGDHAARPGSTRATTSRSWDQWTGRVTGAPWRSSVTASSGAGWPRPRSPAAGRCAHWRAVGRPSAPRRPRPRGPGRRRASSRRPACAARGRRPRRLRRRHREAGRVQRAPDARDRRQPGSAGGHPRGHASQRPVGASPCSRPAGRSTAPTRPTPTPETAPLWPISTYGVLKVAAERYVGLTPGSRHDAPTSSAAPTSTGLASRPTGPRG